MSSTDDRVFAALMVSFMAVLLGALWWTDSALNQMKRDAVKFGHAEWYATREGGQPTQWRWKEASGDE